MMVKIEKVCESLLPVGVQDRDDINHNDFILFHKLTAYLHDTWLHLLLLIMCLESNLILLCYQLSI